MPDKEAIRAWVAAHRADLAPFLEAVKEEIQKEESHHD
jgi:hypothetical protein